MKKRYIFLTLTLCFFGVINTYSQVPSYVPTDSLVGYWPFSGNAIDSSGNSMLCFPKMYKSTNFINRIGIWTLGASWAASWRAQLYGFRYDL